MTFFQVSKLSVQFAKGVFSGIHTAILDLPAT